jgi:DNA primase
MHCKQVLYNENNCNRRSVIVVEGLFDAFRFGDGCVCTFGTKVTAEQKILLSRFEDVKVVFDGDDDGRKSGQQLADDLSAFTKTTIIYLDDGDDPDSLSEKQIKQIKEM